MKLPESLRSLICFVLMLHLFAILYGQNSVFFENGYKFTLYDGPNGLGEGNWHLSIDSDQQLILTGLSSVRRFDGSSIQKFDFQYPDGLSRIRSYSCSQRDRSGILWTLDAQGELTKLNPLTGETQVLSSTNTGMPSVVDRGIVQDSEGQIWVGMTNGIYKAIELEDTSYLEPVELFKTTSQLLRPYWDSIKSSGGVLAELHNYASSEPKDLEFYIEEDSLEVVILGMGSGWRGNGYYAARMYDYGWISDTAGETVWKMIYTDSHFEGGSTRLIFDKFYLQKGKYILHYKSTRGKDPYNWASGGVRFPLREPDLWGIQLGYGEERWTAAMNSISIDRGEKERYLSNPSSVFQDSDESIWTYYGGIAQMDYSPVDKDNSEPFNYRYTNSLDSLIIIFDVCSIDSITLGVSAKTTEGDLYIGLYDKRTNSLTRLKVDFPRDACFDYARKRRWMLTDIEADQHGNLWLCGGGHCSLYKLPAPFIKYNEPGGAEVQRFGGNGNGDYKRFQSLIRDSQNNLWASADGGYLCRIDLDSPEVTRISIPNRVLDSLSINNGILGGKTLWISLFSQKSKKRSLMEYNLENESFQHHDGELYGQKFNYIYLVDKLSDGRLICITDEGVWIIDPVEKGIETLETSLDLERPYFHGYFMVNDSVMHLLTYIKGKGNINVFYNIYNHRLLEYRFPELETLAEVTTNPPYVRKIGSEAFVAQRNTSPFGYYLWSDDSVTQTYQSQNRGMAGPINAIRTQGGKIVASMNSLYILSAEGKLITRDDNKELMAYLENDHVLLEGKDGYIFILNRGGCIRYHVATGDISNYYPLEDIYQALKLGKEKIRKYSFNDGSSLLFSNKYDSDLYLIEPENLPIDSLPPLLAFDQLVWTKKESSKEYSLDDYYLSQSLVFQHHQNNISISYKAIEYDYPQGIRYAYKLEGYNDDWQEVGSERIARFLSLSPGKYTFSFKAASPFGVWSEPKSFSFVIRSPWYWSPVSQALYLMVILATVYAIYRWRTKEQREKLAASEDLNQRLQQVDKLKDQFLANTSHELRTPLNGIIGIAEGMYERETDDEDRKNLGMVVASGKRLASLVNDLLDFSRIKNADLALRQRPVDLRSLVEVVLQVSYPLTQGKNLQLRNEIPVDFPSAFADEDRLSQVLYNLVGNAIKFTEEGEVKVAAEQVDGELRVSIIDTGIGIPENKLDAIFQEFVQADGSIQREFAGTGLGLSISRQLIRAHGGKMWVESVVGEGSTFLFTLPLSEQPAEQQAELMQLTPLMPSQVALGAKLIQTQRSTDLIRILIVDDEPINHQVLKNHLRGEEFELYSAMNGLEALELLEQTPFNFDLILLDVMMPRMSGYEVAQKIRERYLPSELPIILVTAKNQVADLVRGLETGANDYLAKPFTKDEFLARLHTHLNLQQINRATSRFVPAEFIRSLGREDITEVQLGDYQAKEVTVFFSDIRDYTTMSEQMSPEETFNFVKTYAEEMGPLIQEHQGFISQYLGDGIMALFQRSPYDALQSAIRMQHSIGEYNHKRDAGNRHLLRVGMGLHTGPLIMGIIGDRRRSDATVIADTVNTAARLEGLTKYYGAQILLSEDSYTLLPDEARRQVRYLGLVQVKGRQQPMGIYECYAANQSQILSLKEASHDDFQKALNLYIAGDMAKAAKGFDPLARAGDLVASYFLARASHFLKEGLSQDWEGVDIMERK